MDLKLHKSWEKALNKEFVKPYFKSLITFVTNDYSTHVCFPPKDLIYNAFNSCALDTIKVVIIGQDPYHNHNQANGLCFSVNDGVVFPPSLVNIFKELQSDTGKELPLTGNLQHWANQGVFLLNATLTVRAHEAGSHQKQGWETFTDKVITTISSQTENVVFLLWGGFAKKKAKLIDTKRHRILESGHPSPLSANRGYWFGHKHFSQTNTILKALGREVVIW